MPTAARRSKRSSASTLRSILTNSQKRLTLVAALMLAILVVLMAQNFARSTGASFLRPNCAQLQLKLEAKAREGMQDPATDPDLKEFNAYCSDWLE